MVTYINAKNREAYETLFGKAKLMFEDASRNGTLPEGIDITNLEIATLNQYFAYLKDLISISSSEDIKRYFTRLPLDEDVFAINANTRVISVPNSFARYGVGVQGDETAEIVYFTINRFFDSMDLAGDDIHIIIQWETKNINGQTITGISPNYGKDIETIPGTIIFGWPIYSELTASPTPIKFAVRFFSLGEIDNDTGLRSLNYSLSTLPAEVSVGATLNYDLINGAVTEIDRGKMITGRIKKYSGIYDTSSPIPELPIITTPLYAIGENSNIRIIDLPPEVGSTRELAVSAKPNGDSAISYDWKRWAYDANSGEYANTSDSLTSNINNGVYVLMQEDLGNDIYYRITNSISTPMTYQPISVEDYLDDTTYYSNQDGFLTKDGDYIALYKKMSVATVGLPGIYTVDVEARNGLNSVPLRMDSDNGIKIPGPYKPNVIENDTHIIVGNSGEAVLVANASAGETGKDVTLVGENPQVVLNYQWKKKIGNNNINVEDDDSVEYSFNENKSEMTVSNLAEQELDVSYFVEVTATRNRISTSKNSGDYRLTNAPEKPILLYRVFENGEVRQVEKDYQTEPAAIPINLKNRAGVYNKLGFSIQPPILSDKLSYVWMRATVQDINSDWDENERPILQVDLDNLLPDLFEDIAGEPDMAVDGVFGLTTLTSLGQVVNTEDNGPTLQLGENTPSGYYYCIVVNELNNHRTANVSPFFHVTE